MSQALMSDFSIESFRIEERRYERTFAKPLRTAWGSWEIREGTIVRLEDPLTGRIGFGEMAPLPDAMKAVNGRAAESSENPYRDFALWTAQQTVKHPQRTSPPVLSAALLTLGPDTPEILGQRRAAGYRTFKLKVGIADPSREGESLQSLAEALLPGEKLRLDPNRSWDAWHWEQWKSRLVAIADQVEFVEEPFPGTLSRQDFMERVRSSPVPFALDESLIGGGLADWLKTDWPGWWILKPSLLGNPEHWLKPLLQKSAKVVVSSAFESGIGMSALVHLAARFPDADHGLGTQAYFGDTFGTHQAGPRLTALSLEEQEGLWNRLPGK